jgi:hypothetical protein
VRSSRAPSRVLPREEEYSNQKAPTKRQASAPEDDDDDDDDNDDGDDDDDDNCDDVENMYSATPL